MNSLEEMGFTNDSIKNTQQQKVLKKYEDHEQQEQPTLEVEDIVDSTGKLINEQPAYDQIINAEVQLQLGEEMLTGKATQRTIGTDGQVTGTYDNNPSQLYHL